MTTLETVRQSLATAIETAGYKAHEAPLATVIPPAVVIVPDDPYLEVDTFAAGGLSWRPTTSSSSASPTSTTAGASASSSTLSSTSP